MNIKKEKIMNKFCIIYNPEKENALEVVEKIKSYLKINKKECFIYENNFKADCSARTLPAGSIK